MRACALHAHLSVHSERPGAQRHRAPQGDPDAQQPRARAHPRRRRRRSSSPPPRQRRWNVYGGRGRWRQRRNARARVARAHPSAHGEEGRDGPQHGRSPHQRYCAVSFYLTIQKISLFFVSAGFAMHLKTTKDKNKQANQQRKRSKAKQTKPNTSSQERSQQQTNFPSPKADRQTNRNPTNQPNKQKRNKRQKRGNKSK